MAANRLPGSHASKAAIQLSGALGDVGRPHLKEAIREAGFEDAACDRRERAVETEVGLLPELFLAALEGPERLRLLGAEFHATIGAEDFNEPCVRLARGEAFHFEADRDLVAVDFHFGV